MSEFRNNESIFERFSNTIAGCSGKPITFVAAVAFIGLWAIAGPAFGFSETWQLVVNTATTIVTFLMVFVLQNSQNRDGRALQAKLDELIITSRAANKYVGIEKLDEKHLRELSDKLEEEADRFDEAADMLEEPTSNA